jgi:hypothetical protein
MRSLWGVMGWLVLSSGCLFSSDTVPVLAVAGKTYEATEPGRPWYWNRMLFREDRTYRWEWGQVDSLTGDRRRLETYEEGTYVLDPSGAFFVQTAWGVSQWEGIKLHLRVTQRPDARYAIGYAYDYYIIWDRASNSIRFAGMKWHEVGAVPKMVGVE